MTLTGCWFLFDYLDTQPLSRTYRTRAAAVKGWVEELTGHRTALFLPEKDRFGVVGTDRNEKGMYCIWYTCGPIGLDSESMIDSAHSDGQSIREKQAPAVSCRRLSL